MRFLGDVLKKTLTSMFLTMFETSWNIVLTMHISDVFVENFKRIEICDKSWQQCVYSNHLLTKILAWQAILYQRGINIEGPNHFWHCGPRPKTSRKTSHFLLNDAMFQRCFEKKHRPQCFWRCLKKPKHRINDASNDVNRP